MANPDGGDTATMRAVVIDSFGGPSGCMNAKCRCPRPAVGKLAIAIG